jgi:hypothetical protein
MADLTLAELNDLYSRGELEDMGSLELLELQVGAS